MNSSGGVLVDNVGVFLGVNVLGSKNVVRAPLRATGGAVSRGPYQ